MQEFYLLSHGERLGSDIAEGYILARFFQSFNRLTAGIAGLNSNHIHVAAFFITSVKFCQVALPSPEFHLIFYKSQPIFVTMVGFSSGLPRKKGQHKRRAPVMITTPPKKSGGLLDLRKKVESTMPTGTVKWFNTTKGFGFIAPDGGGTDVFVHISAVERAGMKELPDNMKIGYELREGRDGRSSAVELTAL